MTQNKLSKKNRTIIDITQLVHWGGGLTGIPRVMNELSLRYAKNPNTFFVVWSKVANCFYELDIDKSLARRGEGIFYKDKKETTDTTITVLKTQQEHFFSLLKRAAKKVEKYNPRVYKKAASRFNKAMLAEVGSIIQIEPNDELIVLWGEWGDDSYRAALLHAKENRATLIQVVYDMLPIVTPQYSGHSTSSMQDYYTQIIPLCDLILSISEYTKNDLKKWLRMQKLTIPKIEVFRLGDDFALSRPKKPSDEQVKDVASGKERYILCVGTVEARKNHTLLYYVYKLAKTRGHKLPKLVIVGRRGWKTDDIIDIMKSDPDVSDDIVFMQDASDEELSWFYRNCMFTVYPSFYEGWGLPIAESIAYGKPCISSGTSSMPEVAGALIDYFSPLSTDECLNAITKLLSKKELDSAKKRINRYKITSWDDTYDQVNNAIINLYATKS